MENKNPKIDADAIVSPKNTRKLYGDKPLDQDEPAGGQGSDTPTSLPESVDDIDQNMFPSAP
ncbi:hypothetical protein KW796_00525 [Candidatus Parcubacteria bacterium]|nr:hypothetical protein [Candidatus Parcubacteria bacterium]